MGGLCQPRHERYRNNKIRGSMTELIGGEKVYAPATSQTYRYIGTQNVDLESFGKTPDLHPNIDRLEEEEDRNS